MPYNPTYVALLHADLSALTASLPPRPLGTQRMFGGLALLYDGRLIASAHSTHILYRCGATSRAEALALAGVTPAQMGGRVMSGYLCAEGPALADAQARQTLLSLALREVAGRSPP